MSTVIHQAATIPPGKVLLREAWARYRQQWRLYVGIMLFPLVGKMFYFAIALLVHLDAFLKDESYSRIESLLRILQTPETLLPLLLFLAISIWSAVALLFVAVRQEESGTVLDAYREAGRSILSYLWIAWLVSLISLVGFLLLIVPGVLFTVWFSLAVYVFAAEGIRGVDALRKSREYVRGQWWSIAWRIAFISIAMLLFTFLVGFLGNIATFLSSILLAPSVGTEIGVTISVYNILGVRFFDSLVYTLLLTPLVILYMSRVYDYVRSTEFVPTPATYKGSRKGTSRKRKTLILVAILSTVVVIGVWGWSAILNYPFFSHLRAPETPIEEVIIRGYGEVPSYILEAAENAVEQKIGVRTHIESSRPEFGEQMMHYYNRERGQSDGDRIWDSEREFASSVSSKRLVMIVDVDVYTEIQPERPYVLSRSSPNVSVILISMYRLQKLSDTNDAPAPPELVAARIQKLTLQTLGVSVFLEGFSFSRHEDISCVMYRGRVLSELDKQGNDFCEKNKKKLKDYFVIDG